jgi:ABC-type multidrug transport system fused ATPase/permease subunit
MIKSIFSNLKYLWCYLNPRRRKQLVMLLTLMMLASFSEVLTIGVIVPFLAAITSPEIFFDGNRFSGVATFFGFTEPRQIILPITVVFCLAAILAGALRLGLLWSTTRLSFAIGADISLDIYRRTLYQPYAVHCARNSGEIINGITGKSNSLIYNILGPSLVLINSLIMLASILGMLLMVEPIIALVTFGGFGLIYGIIIRVTRKKQLADSICMARESSQVIKSLQEGLGGIRDVLIDGSQETFCQIYQRADLPLRKAQGSGLFIGASPRYAMEALGIVLIACLAYLLTQQENGVAKAIPILGMLALGAQRLLPALQQAYGSWAQIRSGQASLRDTIDLLNQPLSKYNGVKNIKRITFNRDICLKKVDFRYSSDTPLILSQLSLTIPKGSRTGFIGVTGSGKSTLLDIVMGLLNPQAGALEIDGVRINSSNMRSWQEHVAHVPQAIFLSDSTIEENIAFGVHKDEIDSDRVKYAANQAQISDVIESWPGGYQTNVGERGVRLSGGQRQRIGIARALYRKASVIIFDEATSALDSQTEESVMAAIEGLSKELTLLIIAHRVSTLKNCSQVVELSCGKVARFGAYKDIVWMS